MISEWPKRRFQQGSMTDEEANTLVVCADLAQELYEAARDERRGRPWSGLKMDAAIARYEREVKNG